MSTSQIILQAGITNGDYEAAGFSGQLDVVTLDTYNESEGRTGDTTSIQDLVPVVAVIVVLLAAVIILLVVL